MSRSSHSKKLTGGVGSKTVALTNEMERLRFDGEVDDDLLQTLARAETKNCIQAVAELVAKAPERTRLEAAKLMMEWGWASSGAQAGQKFLQRHGLQVNVLHLSEEHRLLELKKETLEVPASIDAALEQSR